MSQFEGFPARMEFTSIPNYFFSAVLPDISDMGELKTTLHVMAALYRKRGYPRFVTYHEMLGNASLMSGLKEGAESPDQALRRALEMATRRGTFIHITLEGDGSPEDAYFLNTESDRKAVARIESGELKIGGFTAARPEQTETEEPPDIFTLYEQNIGMLTPMIADELKEAEKLYPADWIRDAIKEAVALNKRNIRYIMRILERWSAEGKSDGAHQRISKKGPDKYLKQRYGHIVKR
jgi:DNA replication protein